MHSRSICVSSLRDRSHCVETRSRTTASSVRPRQLRPNLATVRVLLCWAATLSCIAMCSEVNAGISGENIVVVVNGESMDSLTLANHYADLRKIPASNMVVLQDIPSGLRISLDDFRDRILKPVLEKVNQRGLARHTSVIAYSAGFPTAVDIRPHTKQLTDENQKKYQRPVASINSMTFFYRWVLADSPEYLGWGSNFYARGRFERHFANPFANEAGERFKEAEQAFESAETQEDWTAAATLWANIADEYPTLYPMHLRTAEAHAQAGDLPSAMTRLQQSVSAGWSNRRYVEESEALSKLQGIDGYAKLLEQLQDVPMKNQGPASFNGTVGWTSAGHPIPSNQGGMPYLLSCVLGVVHERGSTLQQAIEVLQTAVRSDRSFPDGTVGFAKTKDVRVTTREPLYVDALTWLMSRDRDVEIFSSTLPTSSNNYIGLMLGSASLNCKARKWSMQGGAIAENLTSLGGAFETASQTKLTELLHAGAAISSGAVAEPYALVPKFPTPMLHAYYVEGVSAIEAFYLCTTSPYQLLIVGDPACQPFAKAPIDFIRIDVGQESDGKLPIEFHWQEFPRNNQSTATASIEIHLQDKLIAVSPATKKIEVKLPSSMEGALRCRAVMVGHHPTQPRVATMETVVLGNPNALPTVRLETQPTESQGTSSNDSSSGEKALRVACPDADRIELKHFGRVIAETKGNSGTLRVSNEQVGNGPVQLEVIGYIGDRAIPGKTIQLKFETTSRN